MKNIKFPADARHLSEIDAGKTKIMVTPPDNVISEVTVKQVNDLSEAQVLEKVYTKSDVDSKIADVNKGIEGNVNVNMTLAQLNALKDGVYECETAGLYKNGLTAKEGYSTRFQKKGNVWTLFSEVEMPKVKSVSIWIAQDYSNQAQVFHDGITWELSLGQNALPADVPNISPKWIRVSGNTITLDGNNTTNLFLKDAVRRGESINLTTFAVVTSLANSFSISNKISCVAGDKHNIKGRTSVYAIRFEDNSGNLISGISVSSGTDWLNYSFNIPQGATSYYFGSSREGDGQNFDNIVVNNLNINNVERINGNKIIASKVSDNTTNKSGDKLATEKYVLSVAPKIELEKESGSFNLFIPSLITPNASISTVTFNIATGQTSGFSYSNKINCIAGHRYKIQGRTSNYGIRWQTTSGDLVSGTVVGTSQANDFTATAPLNSVSFLFGSSREGDGQNFDNIVVLDLDAVVVNRSVEKINNSTLLATKVVTNVKNSNDDVLATEKYVDSKLSTSVNFNSSTFGLSKLGLLNNLNNLNYDILHFVEYGQSLSIGSDSNQSLTTTPINGNFMLGASVSNKVSSTFNPLRNMSNNEDSIVSIVNDFSVLYRKFVEKTKEFLATSAGVGGQVIDSLSKVSLNGDTYYLNNFIAQINNAKTGATTRNKTIGCPAIIYIQGESDYTTTRPHAVINDANNTADRIALYKQRLIQLKNDMQADIMATYGQSEKPLFFVHNPMGSWSTSQDIFVHTAQIQACDENPDMILLGSPCFVPRFKNEHLSSNGYRWWGEMIAKYVSNTLINGYKSEPLRPKKYTILDNSIFIDYYVPVEPLRINTWTVKETANYGFNILIDGTWVNPTKVEIYNSTTIKLTLPNNLNTAASVQVKYGSRNTSDFTVGTGNICDSDKWNPMYTYAEDSTEVGKDTKDTIPYRPLDKIGGSVINEKPYPMQNWSILFSEKIK